MHEAQVVHRVEVAELDGARVELRRLVRVWRGDDPAEAVEVAELVHGLAHAVVDVLPEVREHHRVRLRPGLPAERARLAPDLQAAPVTRRAAAAALQHGPRDPRRGVDVDPVVEADRALIAVAVFLEVIVLILGRLDVVAERGRRRGRVGRLLLVALAPSLTDLLVALAPVALLT